VSSGPEFVILRQALKELADASERLRVLEALKDEELTEDSGADDLAALNRYRAALERARWLTQ
jgi:hypothetical protein